MFQYILKMNPKEKAIELYEKFYFTPDEDGYYSSNKFRAKANAQRCCDEILKIMIIDFKWDKESNGNIIYWEEVREELEY